MNRNVSLVVLCFIIALFVLLLFKSSLLNPAYLISNLISSPRAYVYQLVYGTKEVNVSKLTEENRKLRASLADLKSLKADNEALRNQFEETTIPSSNLLPAKVIGFSGAPQNPQSLVVDQGSNSGVTKGSVVVLDKQLVGIVSNINPYFSSVMLVTNTEFTTLAETLENKVPGIVRGADELILFDHVVITDVLKRDEVVVTKGEKNISGKGMQPGLIIGKIEKINKSETQPFQSATVKSFLDFSSLSLVFVMVE